MLSSRKFTSWNIAKQRLENTVIEIGSSDLRFSRNEIAFMFLKYSATSLCESEIKKIEKRTEGWPAALQLVYMLGGSEKANNNNPQHFNNAYIQDYIREEILDRSSNIFLAPYIEILGIHEVLQTLSVGLNKQNSGITRI